ncbi:MAG: DUF167 domain-containing protein [Pirellulales bacterium]
MIGLRPHQLGTLLPVRAQPGARRNELRGEQDGRLKVCVTQPPEKGKANEAMVALLAERLGLRKGQLALVAGETSSRKEILIRGLAPAEVRRRLMLR